LVFPGVRWHTGDSVRLVVSGGYCEGPWPSEGQNWFMLEVTWQQRR